MAYLLYYLVLLPLSWLPLRVLYWLSDFLNLVVYRIFGYRKEVVKNNMRRAFPEWSTEEVDRQADAFYHYLFDTIVESVKNYSMSLEEALKRADVVNPEAVAHLAQEKRSCILVGAHYGNWEIGGISFPTHFRGANVMAVYSPMKNKVMDRLTKANRERSGVTMTSRRIVYDYMDKDELRPAVDIFVADQSPSNAVWQKLHWTRFLNQDTAFLAGPERFAVRYDRPIYYINFRRLGRGRYSGKIYPISERPRREEAGYITECFARHLEYEIRRDPTPWLWTHRRWKRDVPPEVHELLKTQDYIPADYDRDKDEEF